MLLFGSFLCGYGKTSIDGALSCNVSPVEKRKGTRIHPGRLRNGFGYEDGRIIITPGKEDPVADVSPEELSRMLTPAQKKQLAAKVREMISKNV